MRVFRRSEGSYRLIGRATVADDGLGLIKVSTGSGASDFVCFVTAWVPSQSAGGASHPTERAVVMLDWQDPALLPGWEPAPAAVHSPAE